MLPGAILVEDSKSEIFEAIFENTELLVFGLDAEGHIILFNRACERVSGYSSEEVIGHFFWDLLIHEEAKRDVLEAFAGFLAGEEASSFADSWLTKEGEERLIAWKTKIGRAHV